MIIDLKNGKNGTAPVVRLNSGHMLPVVGLGTYALHGDACVNAGVSSSSKWISSHRHGFIFMEMNVKWGKGSGNPGVFPFRDLCANKAVSEPVQPRGTGDR